MRIFRFKARTADTYLAGIGASGALMASAFVLFVLLAGVATFHSWPRASQLLGGGAGNIALDNVAVPNSAPPQPQAPDLVALLGGPGTPVGAPGRPPGHARVVSRPRPHPGGSVGGELAPQGGGGTVTVPPSPPPPGQTSGGGGGNAVTRVLSGVGNNVESDTNSLGDSLGGNSSPGLGGIVGSVGRTVNDTLQTLAGNR